MIDWVVVGLLLVVSFNLYKTRQLVETIHDRNRDIETKISRVFPDDDFDFFDDWHALED